MGTHLTKIVDSTRARLAEKMRRVPVESLEAQARVQDGPRDFLGAIRAPGISVVAEIKRRSPSAGEIRAGVLAGEIAEAYEKGGARAISVLTEPEFFGGSLEDLKAARDACGVPVLRKDFLIDPYQVVEARAAGADAVLVIVAAISDRGLIEELIAASKKARMTVLCEVHKEAEIETGLEAGAELIGINQRDLATFEVDAGLAARLRPRVPQEVAVIAESGITGRADVVRLEEAGLDAVLVGEALMRAPDPERAVAELLGR